MNPLLQDWDTPFGLPPFSAIATDDFGPAFDAALAEARSNIDAIAGDAAEPDFRNTIEAMERAERSLDRVAAVFFGLAGALRASAFWGVFGVLAVYFLGARLFGRPAAAAAAALLTLHVAQIPRSQRGCRRVRSRRPTL